MNLNKTQKIISPLLLTAAALIWGLAFTAQKAAQDVPAFTTGVTRSLFATVFLFFIVMLFDRISGNGRRLVSKKGLDLRKIEIRIGRLLRPVVQARLLDDCQDVGLLYDDQLLAFDLDLCAGKLVGDDLIADLDFHGSLLLTGAQAGAYSDDDGELGLLLSGACQNDAALGCLFGFCHLENDSVLQRYEFHCVITSFYF